MKYRLLLAVALSGCHAGENLSTETLTGFWRPHDGENTVFVFAPASDGERLFDLALNNIAPQTKPLSGVYVRDELKQLATYEVGGGELRQQVLADAENPPGTRFATKIYDFQAGQRLTLHSSKLGGPRVWDFYDACPRSAAYGWAQSSITGCPNALTTGGSMAFGPDGTLYAYTGSGLAPGTSCPPAPGFVEVGPGCRIAQFEAPNALLSSTRVHADGVLRIAFHETTSRDLRVRERAAGETSFKETTLAPALNSFPGLFLLDRGAPLLLTNARAPDGTPLAFHLANGTWQPFTLAPRADAKPWGTISSAAVDPTRQRLVLGSGTDVWREGDATFEAISAPGTVNSVWVDPAGALHATFNTRDGLEYGVRKGTTWERRVLDAAGEATIVTHGDGPLRVMTVAPAYDATDPWLAPALISAFPDGHLESELAGSGSINRLTLNTTSVAVGPRGEVAASLTGEVAMTRLPQGRLFPTPKQFQVVVDGPPLLVTSSDGRYRCSDRCTFDGGLGERIAFQVEQKPHVLASLTCDRGRNRTSAAPCWFRVVPPKSASTMEQVPVFTVTTRATPLLQAFRAGSPQGIATTFGISGDWVAVAPLFSGAATEFMLDDVAVPVSAVFESTGLLWVNRVTKASAFAALPRGVGVRAVQPDGAGGLWALVATVNQVVSVGGVTIGASQQSVLSYLHLTAAAKVDANVTVVGAPVSAGQSVIAWGLGRDGSAAAVVSSAMPLTSLGVSETNALVRLTPSGTRTAHGFAGPTTGGGPLAMRDGDRIAFAANTTALGRPAGATLWLWHQGRLDSLALAQANIRALDVAADQVVLAVQSAASPLAAGSQSSTGLKHVLTVDEAMNVTQVLGFPTAANPSSWAVASVTGGIGFLAEGELRWLSGTLAPLKPVRPLPNTAMVTSGIGQLPTQVVNGRWWVLAPAGMDYPEGLSGVSLAELEID